MNDDLTDNFTGMGENMNPPIIVVTGFGRCGSSLVMQMLEAGGMPCTGEYPAFEAEYGSVILGGGVLTADMLAALQGRAVKLLDLHRGVLPKGPDYRVIWINRNHAEQGKSQAKFLSTLTGMSLGRNVARDFSKSYGADTPKLRKALARAGVTTALCLTFETVLAAPRDAAAQIAAHVGIPLTRTTDMANVVRARDPVCAPDLSLELTLIAERDAVAAKEESGLSRAIKIARGGDAPPPPFRGFA